MSVTKPHSPANVLSCRFSLDSASGTKRVFFSSAMIEAVDEAVTKHGIVFVNSMGNEGPALATPKAPNCSSDFVIGV